MEDKNNKGMCPSPFGIFHLHKIPPSSIPGPSPSTSAPPSRLSLVGPASSTEPQTCSLRAHPGREGKPASATRDEGGGRWSSLSLDSHRAYTLITSEYLLLLGLSGHIMSSSSSNIHNKRLPCKFFSKPSHLLQAGVLYYDCQRMRITLRIHFVVLDVE